MHPDACGAGFEGARLLCAQNGQSPDAKLTQRQPKNGKSLPQISSATPRETILS